MQQHSSAPKTSPGNVGIGISAAHPTVSGTQPAQMPPSPSIVGGLRVLCGTWNVNGNLVGLDSLSAWICPTNSSVPAPHIVAVSLQEIVDLKDLKNYVNDDDTKNQVLEWGDAIVGALKERYLGISFSVMKRVSLVGTCLIVIIQTHLLRYVRDVKKARAATGTFGVLGNKGGCGVRFRLLCDGTEISICFMGLHLAAHQREVTKRNQDWDNIISKLNFNEQEIQQYKRRSSNQLVVGLGEFETGGQVLDHDVVFVMGDLNYRIDAEDQLSVLDQIRRKDLTALLSKDQLLNEMKLGHVARGFVEPPVSFPPTYKFQPGTSKYETRHEKKKRIPAWCDRILYYTRPGGDSALARPIKCERYRACPSLLCSDHKPVSADFYLGWITPPPAPMPSPRAIATAMQMAGNSPSKQGEEEGNRNRPEANTRALGQYAIAIQSVETNGPDDDVLALIPGDRVEILAAVDSKTLLGLVITPQVPNNKDSTQAAAAMAFPGKVGFIPSSAVKLVGVFESRATEKHMKQAMELVIRRKQAKNLRLKKRGKLADERQAAPLSPPLRLDVASSSSSPLETKNAPRMSRADEKQAESHDVEDAEEDDSKEEGEEDTDDEGEEALVVDSGWRRANMDFTARREDEVSFRAGEMVEILSQDSGMDGWWIARVRNFDQGLVPAFCFQAKTNEISTAPPMLLHSTIDPTTPLVESESPATFSMRHRTFSFEELDPAKVVAKTHNPPDQPLIDLTGK